LSLIQIGYPGAVSAKPSSQFSFVGEGSKNKAGSEHDSCGGSVRSDISKDDGNSSVGSFHSKRSSGSGANKGAGESRGGPDGSVGEDGDGLDEDGLLSADDQGEFDELLLGDYEDYIAQQGLDSEGGEGGDSDEEEEAEIYDSGGSGGGAGDEDEFRADEGGIRIDGAEGAGHMGTVADGSTLSSATGKSSSEARTKASRAAAAAINARRRSAQIDFDSIAAYTMNGSTVASLLKACLHLENEEVFYQSESKIAGYLSAQSNNAGVDWEAPEVDEELEGGEGDVHRGGTMLLHPDLDLSYLQPDPSSTHRAREGGREEGEVGEASASTPSSARSKPSLVMADPPPRFFIPPERVSKAMLDLRARGVSGFLADLLLAPRRASRAHALSWCSWRSLLELLRSALKNDFDALQSWR
jgi:hypothetical protein